MAAHEPASPEGEKILSGLAGIARLTNTKTYTGSTLVVNATTAFFVQSTYGNNVEGRVTGVWYNWQPDDYQTSVIELVVFDPQATNNTNMPSSARVMMPRFVIPAPVDGFFYPFPLGPKIMKGQGVALQATNGEAAPMWARGWITVEIWDANDRQKCDEDLARANGSTAPWARNGAMLTTRGVPQ
jgi:hypothetical protein